MSKSKTPKTAAPTPERTEREILADAGDGDAPPSWWESLSPGERGELQRFKDETDWRAAEHVVEHLDVTIDEAGKHTIRPRGVERQEAAERIGEQLQPALAKALETIAASSKLHRRNATSRGAALERMRADRQRGVEKTNTKKAQSTARRNAQLYAQYNDLVRQGLAERKHEREARARAVAQLAREHNVKPQRVRDIIRAEKKRRSNSASR